MRQNAAKNSGLDVNDTAFPLLGTQELNADQQSRATCTASVSVRVSVTVSVSASESVSVSESG